MSVGVAFVAWTAAYVVALPLQALVISLSGYADQDSDTWPISITVVSVVLLWIPFIVALAIVSRQWGSSRPLRDFKVSFRPADIAGIPLGVASQLFLLPLVYWPLQQWFPETFSSEEVEERARTLWDKADGGWVIALVAVVVIGAPLIEEIVYRGMILQSLQGRFNEILALVLSAAWFAAIHLQPVELPGLFFFAIVLGLCYLTTGRLGSAILAHAAFNATGLLLIAL